MRHKTIYQASALMLVLFTWLPVVAQEVNKSAKEALSPTPTESQGSKDTFERKNQRLLLALGGGGCKAISQIGVLRSLEKHHIPINGIVGTSMGATIGSLYCAGVPLDDIEKMFVDGTIQKRLPSHMVLKTLTRPFAELTYFVVPRPYGGLTDGRAYLKLLREKLPATFAELKTPFAAVATNLTDGQTCVLAEGDLPKAVLASNSIPPVLRPVLINGKLYVDGAVKANLPSELAQKMGSDVVVSVVNDKTITSEPNDKFKSIKEVVTRTADIMVGAADRQHANNAEILIYPNVDNVPMVTRDAALIKEAIASGEKATDLMIAKIKQDIVANNSAGAN